MIIAGIEISQQKKIEFCWSLTCSVSLLVRQKLNTTSKDTRGTTLQDNNKNELITTWYLYDFMNSM